MYLNLIKQGWTMNDIDEMDILFYFEVMESTEASGKKEVFIDELNW